MCIYAYVCIYNFCISYNTGKSALPDIYICTMPEGTQHPRVSAYISGKAQVPAYTTSGTLKNCPNLIENYSGLFIVWVVGFDCEFKL